MNGIHKHYQGNSPKPHIRSKELDSSETRASTIKIDNYVKPLGEEVSAFGRQ